MNVCCDCIIKVICCYESKLLLRPSEAARPSYGCVVALMTEAPAALEDAVAAPGTCSSQPCTPALTAPIVNADEVEVSENEGDPGVGDCVPIERKMLTAVQAALKKAGNAVQFLQMRYPNEEERARFAQQMLEKLGPAANVEYQWKIPGHIETQHS